MLQPCLQCGYDLSGLPRSRGRVTCPECGATQPLVSKRSLPPLPTWAICVAILAPWILAALVFPIPGWGFTLACALCPPATSLPIALNAVNRFRRTQGSSRTKRILGIMGLWAATNATAGLFATCAWLLFARR